MKKLLICLLTLLTLVGCGETSDDSKDNEVTAEVTEKEEKNSNQFEEIVVCDNEYLTFKITGIDEEGFWGYTLKALIDNKSGRDVMVSWDGVSVNGFMCDPYWATDIYEGKKATADISWYDTSFEECGIEEVEEVEFTLKVLDYDTWDTIYKATYTITLK